ncbi:heparinase II/III domain-containing protein [Enterococcus faecalis]|nr:heparinase II/III family protein [Enterococcus faecalis]
MTYVYLLQISEYLEISLPLDLRTKLKIPILSTYYIADNQDVLNPINDSDHVNFRYVYDSYRNMKKELGKHCSQRNFFRGESSGLMFYKTEDIYFTLFNGLYGSSHGHVSTGSFTLQLQSDEMMRNSGIEPFELAKSVVKVGKSNIVLFEKNNEAEELSEEGI